MTGLAVVVQKGAMDHPRTCRRIALALVALCSFSLACGAGGESIAGGSDAGTGPAGDRTLKPSGCLAAIAAGGRRTCTRKTDGTLWCWGGGPRNGLERSPAQISALGATVAEVSMGSQHTCARKTDGTLWCWGDNERGQLGDRTVFSKGYGVPVQVSALGTGVAGVAAGAGQTCALKTDSTLWCWGNNVSGELGQGIADPQPQPSPVQVTSLGTSVAEVAAGYFHTCARKTDGTLWCWGANNQGQLGNGTATTNGIPTPAQVAVLGRNVAKVDTHGHHTCALKTDGTLWCWGANHGGTVGDGTSNRNTPTPVQIRALGNNVATMSAGFSTTCASKVDGTLWCWGGTAHGIAEGADAMTRPVQITALSTPVAFVAVGQVHACVVDVDGAQWCWGDNEYGTIGDGSTEPSKPAPVKVPLPCM